MWVIHNGFLSGSFIGRCLCLLLFQSRHSLIALYRDHLSYLRILINRSWLWIIIRKKFMIIKFHGQVPKWKSHILNDDNKSDVKWFCLRTENLLGQIKKLSFLFYFCYSKPKNEWLERGGRGWDYIRRTTKKNIKLCLNFPSRFVTGNCLIEKLEW